MKYPKLLTYAQLLRLPNVFTAFADICLGAAAAGYLSGRFGLLVLVLLTSGLLYLAGMVLNDWFDLNDDEMHRPFRPIPSGRVSYGIAGLLGWGLLAVGVGVGWIAGRVWNDDTFILAAALAAAIVAYNWILKRTLIGPIGMGACRFLNVLLGLSGSPADLWTWPSCHLAAVIGVYIVGVTWFARTEEAASNRRQLMLAAGVMLLAVLGGLLVPIHFAPGTAHPDPAPWYFPYLVAGFIFYVGTPVVRAIRRPEPKPVQAAVKRSILGLVVLDAVLATAFVGWPGLLILLLLPPALWLGKWVYST